MTVATVQLATLHSNLHCIAEVEYKQNISVYCFFKACVLANFRLNNLLFHLNNSLCNVSVKEFSFLLLPFTQEINWRIDFCFTAHHVISHTFFWCNKTLKLCFLFVVLILYIIGIISFFLKLAPK